MKKLTLALSLITFLFCMVGCEPTINVSDLQSHDAEDVAHTISRENSEEILVAYFSTTGNTERAAKEVADILSADIYLIKPTEPYTDEDKDFDNKESRCNVEQEDKTIRPEIEMDLENFESYDIIMLGFPIWFYNEPRLIDTFLESYDFSGKTIVPFCTSGSSSIAEAEHNIRSLVPSANWVKGRRFDKEFTRDTVEDWLIELGLYEE